MKKDTMKENTATSIILYIFLTPILYSPQANIYEVPV